MVTGVFGEDTRMTEATFISNSDFRFFEVKWVLSAGQDFESALISTGLPKHPHVDQKLSSIFPASKIFGTLAKTEMVDDIHQDL